MAASGLIQSLLRELAAALAPVARLRASPAEAAMFLTEIGWPPPTGFDPSRVLSPFDISAELDTAQVLLAELSEDDADFAALIPDLQDALRALIDKIRFAANPGDLPGPYSTSDFWGSFPQELFSYLLREHIEDRLPIVAALLQFVGVINEEQVPARGPRTAYIRRGIEWANLARLFTDPDNLLRETYDWGAAPYRYERLLQNLQRLLGTLHRLDISYPVPELLEDYYAPGNSSRALIRSLYGPLLESVDTDSGSRFSLDVFALPVPPTDNTAAEPVGLVLGTTASGTVSSALDMGPFDVLVRGNFQTAAGLRLEIRPGAVSFVVDGSPPSYDAGVSIALKRNGPTVLVGSESGHRVQVGRLDAEVKLRGTPSDNELIIRAGMTDLELIIQMSEGDGFLRKIFGTEPQTARASIALEWSSTRGLSFVGGAMLDLTIPLHLEWGPVRLDELFLGLSFGTDEPFGVKLGITAGLSLGPITAVVKRIGVRALFEERSDGSGAFGNVDIGFGFLPPTGAGLALEAGPVTGGGFIEYAPEVGRYAGILDLKFTEIGLVAIAIINTKLPGGKDGFALFINIGVTFSPPITLPYNFTLQGCGGLCAVNRTMDTEALRSGLRNKTLDSILFPQDPILNANKIITDSERVFPIEENRFVIGPMAKLGWGQGGLVTANIAIVLELPAPIVIALLGQVKVRVPQSEESKVKLNLDILGVLEIEKKSLSFDATLYDSKVLVYELYGDAAMRLRWGSSPQFAMSVGGFHPKFNPPANFPSLRRLTIALRSTSSFELTAKMYHALTSNTLQFGAKLQLHASACGATLDGDLSFDTLFQFSPFEFDVGISGGLSARFHGRNIASVRLSLDLSGPTPWHAKGKAKVSVLCWDTTARFSKTWGSDNKARVAKIDPLPFFLDELAVVGNWSAALSPRRTIVETLKSLEAPPPPPANETPDAARPVPDFLVHPAGSLAFRQRLLPLNMKLEKFKSADVKTHFKFDVRMDLGPVTAAPIPSTAAPCLPPGISLIENEVQEHFAKAQFKSLSKSDRLSRPSYEKFRAGLEVGPGLVRVDGCVQECELEYESILIMPEGTRQETKAPSRSWALMKRALRIAAMRRSSMRHRRRGKFAVAGPGRVGLKDEAYSIVDKATLSRITHVQPIDAPPINQTQALDLLDVAVAEHLVVPGAAIVVPECEEVTT